MRPPKTPARAGHDRLILSSMVENSDDAIISKRLDGRILSWNRAAERLFGFRRQEMIGESITKIVPRERLAEERMIVSRLRKSLRIDHYETVRRRKDGRLVDVSISVSPIRDAGGQIIGACKIARDISERKNAEDALRRSEQLLRAILDTAADAIITIDHRGIVRSANAATVKLFGYSAKELAGRNVNRLMPEPFHGEHDGYLRNYCRTGRAKIIGIGREVTGQRKDGSTFPMHLSVSEVRLKDQRLFTGIVHDLTERRRLERLIMEIAANEQRRIGQDLHDGLCQDLVGIAFCIDAVARELAVQGNGESMEKLAGSVREAAGQARRLAHGLNPVDLKAGGLAAALENLANKVTESFGIQCSFHWDNHAKVYEDATATHLYRVAQEAVGNAVRHGKAKKVQIGLVERNTSLVMTVTDDGRGIPAEVADLVKQGLAPSGQGQPLSIGMGLQTMHYRARVIGGVFTVSPRKGGGTCITCTIRREQMIHSSQKSEQASEKIRRAKRAHSR
jgi:PAS domain S-box-containing protein